MVNFSGENFLKRPIFGGKKFNMRNSEMSLFIFTSPPICFAIPIMIHSFLISNAILAFTSAAVLLLSAAAVAVSGPLPGTGCDWVNQMGPSLLIGRRPGPDLPYPKSYFLCLCRNTEEKIHKYKFNIEIQKQTG